MTTDTSLKAITAYLKKQHVLSMCVGDADSLWCANFFYVFNESSMAFYFLTDHTTRHGTLLAEHQHVAGTVSDQTITISLIKGVQYSGEVSLLAGDEAQVAKRLYTSRFPLAKLSVSPIWSLRLDEVKLTNNKLGFGTKLKWLREEANRPADEAGLAVAQGK
ncbi:YhbP family protein [Sodalis sp. RH21]|uniref:YhbP family protein n=1 Tax=unclassified Sodalis (in: enterobacteria) TaxID=2636512 RepID=UPI0039B3A857